MRRELNQLDEGIIDTKLKMRTCEMFDEVLLTQLRVPIAEIDPNYEKNRKRYKYFWLKFARLTILFIDLNYSFKDNLE